MASEQQRSGRRGADLVVVRRRDLQRLWRTPGLVSGGPTAWGTQGAASGDAGVAWGSGVAAADARRLVQDAAGTLGVDLRGAGRTGPGAVHGAAGDPRYPSPRELRKVLSFVLDLVLHIGVGVGVAAALIRAGQSVGAGVLAGLAGFVVASAVHRIVVQRLTSATMGKAVTGLRIIRDDTGGPATTGLLIMQWVFGAILIVAGLFS